MSVNGHNGYHGYNGYNSYHYHDYSGYHEYNDCDDTQVRKRNLMQRRPFRLQCHSFSRLQRHPDDDHDEDGDDHDHDYDHYEGNVNLCSSHRGK